MKNKLAIAFICLTALLHIGFMILEIFFWTKPLGLRIFALSQEAALSSATLAMNQGFYNGLLACGLLFSLSQTVSVKRFFLASVIAAGLFGAATVKPSIFFVQALPALIALAFVQKEATKQD